MADPFGYVRQAVVNQHLSWLRRRLWREHPAGGTVELDQVVEQALGDPSAAADRRLALLGALRVLTRRERAIVVLRHVEDLTERETAETPRCRGRHGEECERASSAEVACRA